ncbi:MAG: DUF3727 domain-containing protein [Gloeobacterales cyanobacterium]
MTSEVLVLSDERGRTLDCELLQQIPLESKVYGLVMPNLTPVRVMAWSDDEEEPTLEDLDDEEVVKVFPNARAVLAEQDLSLLDSAYVLVVEGDVPAPDEEDEEEEEDSIYTICEEEGEEEEYQLLASFLEDEREYAVFTPLEPVILFVELDQTEGSKTARLLTPKETDELMPVFEEFLRQQEDEEEEDHGH